MKTRRKRKRKRRKRRKSRKSTYKWKKDNCAADNNDAYSCYSNKSLFIIRDKWNQRHLDSKIHSNNPSTIWNFLKEKMKRTCSRESCWLKQSFMKNGLNQELKKNTFSPSPPETWRTKKNEWLSSVEISELMQQYEKKYKNFEFIGPSPIDYDTHVSHGECVWEELCHFSLEKTLKRKKRKIGVVFNTDPHDKEGAHWVALFIDIDRGGVYYFDSYGDRISPQINKFGKEVIKQAKKLGIVLKFEKNKKRHQFRESECGMYCLYFIIQMIKSKKSFQQLMKMKITDKKMLNLRRKYYNY